MTLSGQIALVTGAGGGIGRACALALAGAGSKVAVCDIRADAAEGVAAEARALGVEAIAITADMSKVSEINTMVDKVVAAYGRLDTIVNNAGVTRAAHIMELTEKDWDWMHAINAKGVFFCLQAAARQMIAQGDGGSIINIASVAGQGFRNTSNAAYAASKGAVISLTMTAAQQLGENNIRVNSICPGVTMTDLVATMVAKRSRDRNVSQDDIMAEMSADIPLKRPNQPEDMGAMAAFLASPGARNISGQNYNVDGGLVPS